MTTQTTIPEAPIHQPEPRERRRETELPMEEALMVEAEFLVDHGFELAAIIRAGRWNRPDQSRRLERMRDILAEMDRRALDKYNELHADEIESAGVE